MRYGCEHKSGAQLSRSLPYLECRTPSWPCHAALSCRLGFADGGWGWMVGEWITDKLGPMEWLTQYGLRLCHPSEVHKSGAQLDRCLNKAHRSQAGCGGLTAASADSSMTKRRVDSSTEACTRCHTNFLALSIKFQKNRPPA